MDPRRIRKTILKRVVQLLGIIVSSVLAMWALYLLTPEPEMNPSSGWDGAYPLLVRRAELPDNPETLVPRFEQEQLITAATAKAVVSVFGDVEQVSIDRLHERLLLEDPRFDPYLRRVGRFFSSPSHPDWEVVYYLSEQPAAAVHNYLFTLQNTFPEGVYYTSNRALPVWVHPLVILGSLVTVGWGVMRTSKHRFWVLLAGIPLVLTSHAGNPVVFCLLAVAFILWVRVFLRMIARWRRMLHHPEMQFWDRSVRTAVASGAALLLLLPVGALLFGSQPMLALVVVLAVLVEIFIGMLAWSWVRLQEQRRDHRLFLPISLRQRGSFPRIDLLPFAVVMLVGVLSITVLGGLVGARPGWQAIQLPRPAESDHDAPLRDLVQTTGELNDSSTRLPHLGDYVAHRAYQAGFPFGRSYGFPQEGEVVTLSTAVRSGAGLVWETQPQIRFTHDWIWGTVNERSENQLESLLLRQGQGTAYIYGQVDSVFFDVSVVNWALILLLFGLLIGHPLPHLAFFLRFPRAAVAKSTAAA